MSLGQNYPTKPLLNSWPTGTMRDNKSLLSFNTLFLDSLLSHDSLILHPELYPKSQGKDSPVFGPALTSG